jgi:exoribonuclease II
MVCAFSKGRASLENDTRPGRPDSARTNENVEETRAIVKQDRRIATRLLTECLGVGKKAAKQILETDLKKMKIYSRFVPHSLRQYRGSIGLNVVEVSSSLLTKIVKCHKEL